MKLHTAGLSSLLVLSFVGTALGSQDGEEKKPPTTQGSPAGPRTSKRAPRASVPVNIPLRSLSVDGAAILLNDVRTLKRSEYSCFDCETFSAGPGKCTDCSAELEAQAAAKVIEKAGISIDRRFLTITLVEDQWGSLTEFESMLAPHGANVKRVALRIPAYSRIAIEGIEKLDEKATAPMLKAALMETELFQNVSVAAEPERKRVWIMPRIDATPVTLGQLHEALIAIDEKARITDVQWRMPCKPCWTKRTIRMNCKTCWSRHAPAELVLGG